MSNLPSDCLNGIFEYLEDDKISLRSCLLVNRLWCEVSVRILWRSIKNYNTLIACLPNESKEILIRMELLLQPQPQTLQCLIILHFVKLYQLIKLMMKLLNMFNNLIYHKILM